ncbi:adenosine deaminase [Streptococcaceae bacterium ESL0729]|nr:adenosine deaminase [Streptococcaceae bacterium ESL0729]
MLTPEIIENLPKTELHCHLDGSLSMDLIRQLARSEQIEIPQEDDVLKGKIHASKEVNSLADYLLCFDFVLPFLQTAENLSLAAYDLARQAKLDRVKYMEVRFAPRLHTKKGLSLKQVVEAVCLGFERAEADFDIKMGGIICGLRHEREADLISLLDLFTRRGLSSKYINGFDLAGDEKNFPPSMFTNLLRRIREAGINLTLHAGECGCGQNVLESIELGAKRIGHGVAIGSFPQEFARLKDQGIVFEMAPTSNFQTRAIDSLENYPFKDLYDAGVLVTINTDNRTVSDTDLNQEYQKIADWYDFEPKDFLRVNLNALEGAFISEEDKKCLKDEFIKDYQAFL